MTNNQSPSNEIIASALRLPIPDRVALVNAMLESIDVNSDQSTQAEIDQSWNDEISLRLKEIESGEVKPVPSSELWKQLGGKPNAGFAFETFNSFD